MGRERSHPYLAYHYWTSQPKSASTPRFFHSITGFAIGGISWPRSQHHPLLHQGRAAHHHLRQRSKHLLHQALRQRRGKPPLHQRRAAHHHPQSARDPLPRASDPHLLERNRRQKGGKNPLQSAGRLQRAHQKLHLQRSPRANQNLAQLRKRKSAAVFELNWAFANQKFQMKAIDTKMKSVGLQRVRSWMIWKILVPKNQRLSLTNVPCVVQSYKYQNQSVTDTRYNVHTPNVDTQT